MLIDPARIADLRAAIGEADTGRLLAMMVSDIADRSQRIVLLLDAGDVSAARREAHALRGGADGIGATRLAALCHAIEYDPVPSAAALRECAAATLAAIGATIDQLAISSD